LFKKRPFSSKKEQKRAKKSKKEQKNEFFAKILIFNFLKKIKKVTCVTQNNTICCTSFSKGAIYGI
jgi:hypothetical protein